MSKIAQLPDEIRIWLHEAFVERAFGDIIDITEQLQAKLREAGIAAYIGKSAVGAESLKVKRAQEAIHAATQAAELMSKTSPDVGGNRGAMSLALAEVQAFDLLLEIREASEEADTDTRLDRLGKSALAITRLTNAKVRQSRWNEEVAAKTKAAAEKVARIAKKGGLDAAAIREIRSSIMGIAARDAAPPA